MTANPHANQEAKEDRPTPPFLLPFRATKDHRGDYWLEWFGLSPDGQQIPYKAPIGNPDADQGSHNPLYVRIYQLMRLYWERESQVDGNARERDELRERVAKLENDLAHERKTGAARVKEIEGRLKKQGG